MLLVVGLGAAGFVTLSRWLSGEECRALIERKTAEALHATTRLAPLRWGWFGVSSESLKASGSDQTALKRLESGGLHARFKPVSLVRGYWGIEEISLEKLVLHLGSPGSEALVEEVVATSPSPLPKWLPSQLIIEAIRTDHADIIIEIPNGGMMKILGTHLEAYPETHPMGDETRIEARGGEYSFTRFPDLRLNLRTLRARISQNGTELTGAKLAPPAGGSLKLEGSFPTRGKASRVSGRWENIPLTALLPSLKDQIVGTLEGSGRAEWSDAGFQLAGGTVSANDVTLSQIPVLEKMAALTGIAAFRNLPVQVAHASYSRRGEVTDWNEVVLESKGLVKCVGTATTGSDGSLSGAFQLGITSSVVAILPFAKEILGLNEHDGFIWMPLRIGGTLSHPTEDLSPRLGMAIAAGATGVAREGIQAGLKMFGLDKVNKGNATNTSTNDPLPGPTDAVKTLEQGADKALDVLGGFLK